MTDLNIGSQPSLWSCRLLVWSFPNTFRCFLRSGLHWKGNHQSLNLELLHHLLFLPALSRLPFGSLERSLTQALRDADFSYWKVKEDTFCRESSGWGTPLDRSHLGILCDGHDRILHLLHYKLTRLKLPSRARWWQEWRQKAKHTRRWIKEKEVKDSP